MKVRLLFPDRDFDLATPTPDGSDDLVADLDLAPVFDAMVPERRLDKLCEIVLLNPLSTVEEIRWRQQILADALADPIGVRRLFDLSGEALDSQRSIWIFSSHNPTAALTGSVRGLEALLVSLRQLSEFATQQLPTVRSPGLLRLYRELAEELDLAYLGDMEAILRRLRFARGVLCRAHVGGSGMLAPLELVDPSDVRVTRWSRLGLPHALGKYRFTIGERDDAGARALADMRDDALYEVAIAVAQAKEHVVGFFRQLRWESGFYLGCVQLHDRLRQIGVPICWPDPELDGHALAATRLRSLSLALRTGSVPVPTDVLDAGRLVIVAGANQGGKTTFLRSVGCGQLLLQAGMFVPADSFRSGLTHAIHSHFRRAEDQDLTSGKLAEELTRMSQVVDRCRSGDLLLMNESFSSTDEVEGTFVAADIIDTLIAHGIRVFAVTHFLRLAEHCASQPDATLLVAERLADGTRSYRMTPGDPPSTSYGMDLFSHVFQDARGRAPGTAPHQPRPRAG